MLDFLMKKVVRHTHVVGQVPEQPKLPLELHPGIASGLMRFKTVHAPLEYSRFMNMQGIPIRPHIRRGVRPATPEPITPPNYSYSIADLERSPKQGVPSRVLIPTLQRPIGRTPQGYVYNIVENQSYLNSLKNDNVGH